MGSERPAQKAKPAEQKAAPAEAGPQADELGLSASSRPIVRGRAAPPREDGPPLAAASVRRLQRELGNAHVARRMAQRQPAPAAPGVGGPALIVEDDAAPGPGQLTKTAFLGRLRPAVEATVQAELAGSALAGPAQRQLDEQFARYAELEAPALERTIRREAPDAARATSAEEYIEPVTQRVRAVIAEQRAGLPPGGEALAGLADAAGGLAAAVGEIFFKRPGDAGGSADPQAVRAQLGPGQQLPGGVRGRMEGAFGESLADVRLHTDTTAATIAGDLGARAFAVGEHVAFAGGQYAPGTPIGDALLAHELAHVIQQRGAVASAPMQKGGDYSALEGDADNAAVGAVVSLWGGAAGALGKLARQAMPQLKSALRLQLTSCASTDREPTVEEAAEVSPQVQISSNIRGSRAGQGATATYEVVGFPETMPPSRPLPYWRVTRPDGTDMRSGPYSSPTRVVELEQVGTYQIIASVPRGPDRYLIVRYAQEVVAPEQLASQEIGQMRQEEESLRGRLAPGQQQPSAYDRFRLGLAATRSNLEHGATHTETGMRPGDVYISSSAANPIQRPGHSLSNQEGRYTVHPSPGARRFQWYAIPSRQERLVPDFHGFRLVGYNGTQAYDLGTGPSARWVLFEADVYTIVCEQRDERGELIQAMPQVRYRQVVLRGEEMQRLEQFNQYVGRADRQIQAIQAGREIGLQAVHLQRENSAVTRLNMFAGPARAGGGAILVDLTPGLGDRHVEHPGATADAVFSHLRSNNDYPPGQIRIEVPANADQQLFRAGRVETIPTTGETFLGRAASGTGLVSMGLAGLGVLAVATGVGAVAAPYLFVAAAASGGVSAGLSLADHLRQTEVSGTMVALDVLGIASSFIGGATAFRALRGPVALAARSTQYLIWSGFATDVVSGVLISVDGWQQIVGVMDNSQMTPQQRMDAIVRILGNLALNGGMMVYGARDLGQAGRRFEQAGVRAIGGLSSEQRYALSVLIRDEALPTLARASADDLGRLVPLARENHELVNRLLASRGEEFLSELRSGRHASLESIAHAMGEVIPARATPGLPAAGAGADPTAAEAGGGVRGRIYDGTGNPRRLSPDRLDRAVGALVPRRHIHGATMQRQGENQYLLRVPLADGTHAEVRVHFDVAQDVSATPSHHRTPAGVEEGGPARNTITPPADATQPWAATVVVQRNLNPGNELPYVLGHEIDEIADVVRSRPNARGRADIAGLQDAGLLRDGSTTTQITSHDRAAARELSDTFTELRRLQELRDNFDRQRRALLEREARATRVLGPDGQPARPVAPPAQQVNLEREIALLEAQIRPLETRLSRMRVWMGLDEVAHRAEKLAALRSLGVNEELVRLIEARAELRSYIESSRFRSLAESSSLIRSSGTAMSDSLVTHLLEVDHPQGGFRRNGLYGGHHTARLRAWVEQHLEYELVETATRSAGGTTYRRFQQYRWVGGGQPPPRGDARRSPAQLADRSLWQLSEQPKTTVDELGALMREADDAFTQWRSAYPELARRGRAFGRAQAGGPPALSSNGVEISGFFDYTPAGVAGHPGASGERWTLRTVFVENQWF